MLTRPSRPVLVSVLALVLCAVLVGACGGGAVSGPSTTSTRPPTEDGSGEPGPAPRPTSDLAALVEPAGSAATLPGPTDGPVPVGLSFEEIGISLAPIVDVGVQPNGDMEIPGVTEIGWYRYGPSPGDEGSAVLAAHIAWDGRDGVFRHLAGRARPGQRFTLAFDDGSIAAYEVTGIAQYPKDELPEDLFATTGDPRVVLITCGGSFNRAIDRYDDNVVVYAVPV